jgi:hypothetical protein
VSIKQEKFTIICIRHTMVFTEEDLDFVHKIVEAARPEYCHYLDPDIIYAYFSETEKKDAHATWLIDQLHNLFQSDHRFYGVGVSMLSAEMSVDRSLWGKIKAPPAGEAAKEASRLAHEEAIKNS